MGSIEERKHPSGRITYKVYLRKRGIPSFTLTFDDIDVACDWMEENEAKYYKDPDKYIKWREDLYYQMNRSLKRTSKHILKPEMRSLHEK